MQGTKTATKDSGREMVHILVVDDEKSICELLEITFRKEGHKVEIAHSVEAAKRKLESSLFDIVISDVRMPGATGVELLRFAREIAPDSYFVLITGVPTLETAIAAANEGANRYVIKDHDLVEQLRVAVREVSENLKWKKEAGYLRREIRRLTGLDNIVGTSPKMKAIFDMIQTVAPQSSRILITGESGTGKELVARAIHENSSRSTAPFITINCGAFPETLLESELFGYMKGCIHRCQRESPWSFPGRSRGHPIYGRDWEHESRHAGETLPRAPGREGSSHSAATKKSMSMFASSRRPTKTWRKPSLRTSSAKTFSIASASFPFTCRLSAIVETTSHCWLAISWNASASRWKSPSKRFRRRP